jgi:hypothetical protein
MAKIFISRDESYDEVYHLGYMARPIEKQTLIGISDFQRLVSSSKNWGMKSTTDPISSYVSDRVGFISLKFA